MVHSSFQLLCVQESIGQLVLFHIIKVKKSVPNTLMLGANVVYELFLCLSATIRAVIDKLSHTMEKVK